MKKINLWTEFGCFLTGWKSSTLKQCTEASKCQLFKYTSALVILIIIWSITGFCFAQRYIDLPLWGCILVSFVFVTIVVNIERQIILASQKSKLVLAFRFVIALIMAIVGSSIFDQMMFGKDIDKAMATNVEAQTIELAQQRMGVIDENIKQVTTNMDSLDAEITTLQEDVNQHPFIIQSSSTTTSTPLKQSDGTTKMVKTPSVTKNEVPNPKQDVINDNKKVLETLRSQKQSLMVKKQTIIEDTRKELRESVGFLEELEAMWVIVSSRPLAGVFYGVFFVLLMSLELFVVVSKFGDSECDYELTLKRAQEIRTSQLNQNF